MFTQRHRPRRLGEALPVADDLEAVDLSREPRQGIDIVVVMDLSGSMQAVLDADPDNYEIATGNLTLADFASGRPIVAYGFPAAFGTAPADFEGRTMIDFTDVRSSLPTM